MNQINGENFGFGSLMTSPQCGQVLAFSDISPPHSLHCTIAIRRVDRSELCLWEAVTVRSYCRGSTLAAGHRISSSNLGDLSLVVSACFRQQGDFGPSVSQPDSFASSCGICRREAFADGGGGFAHHAVQILAMLQPPTHEFLHGPV